MPDYWSDGSPSGSPYTQRWGALRYGPAKGKDIWGGTEIPGLPFSGSIANRSDYWHQMAEQPIKYSGPGMGLDKDPMRYAGSGASMGGIGNGVYGTGLLTFHKGGPVGHKHGISGLWNKFKDQSNKSLTGSMAVGFLEQIGTLGQAALSKLMPSIVSKPTKQQNKNLMESTGVPGTYRALTNKSAEGPMGKDSLAAQKLMDWASLAGWAIPGGKGVAGANSKFATSVSNKVVARQGVQVIDRSMPFSGLVNNVMQSTGLKTPRLKTLDEILTNYKIATDRSALANPYRPVPRIAPGKGAINIYEPLTWDARTAWKDGKGLGGKIKDLMAVLNGKPLDDNSAYANTPTGNIYMPNNASLRTLFHELGHRDLAIGTDTAKTVLGPLYSKNPSHGTHEGYADRFASAARDVNSKYLNKDWTEKYFTDSFQNGNSYVTNPGLSTVEDFLRYIGGAATGREEQITSQFLADYIAAAGPRLGKQAADKMKIYMGILKKYEKEYTYAPGVLLHKLPAFEAASLKLLQQKSLNQNSLLNLGVPKFENGINSVPVDMLAQLHKNEAVIPANMNPFNPNATAAATGSVYNINVELNGTNLTAKDVALEIRNEMRIKEMTAGINRNVGRV
jgi:hypothetical protein